jgi:tetratricopeptide (TPR) repeat protein
MTAFEEGEGQVVTISGEAGVGKSRLLYEFQNWVELLPATQAVFFFQGSSRQEAQGLPYSLLRDLFAFRFQILDEDTGEQARRKIEMGFCDVFGEGEEGFMEAHILGQLLGFNFSASPHLKGVLNDAEQLRNRALMYLVQYFQALAQEHPVVIFLEDAHWGDDSSLDVINRLGEYVLQHPWLIVCAARPTLFERRPYWGEGQTYHTHLELRPLSKRESRQLVGEILKQAEEIPAELRELVVSGSEGNPFYTEELIKMLIEEGVVIPREDTWGIDLTRLEQIDVPSTLAGVLQARLDSLPLQERTVLQQASVVGRLFWDRIVSYIQAEGGDGSDPELIPLALTSLRNRELVYRHEESAFVGAKEYFFKHDVLREVTYESVLKRLRKTYHGLVADWLIENSGGRISEFCGVIAEHLLLAGRKDQACRYFKMAGNSALASYAAAEAERYFRQAFDLSSDTKSRADILFGYGEALSRKGKNDIALDIWRQAIESYKQFGEFDQMAEVYARLSNVLWHSHGYPEAWKVCKDGLEMMEGASDGPGYAHLLAEAGRTALFQNKSEQALLLCNKAIIMAERLGDMEVSADARITLALREENKTRSIVILKEVVELAAENDLLRTLVRATGSLGVWFNYIFDAATSVQYYMQAIQIGEQIGSNTVQSVSNLIEAYNQLGKINDAEDVLVSKIPKVNAPMREKEIFTLVNQGRILFARGDWDKSLEVLQICLDLLHEGKDFQLIGNRNLEMVESALELNYFDKQRNLHIAEIALQENIDYKHDLADSYLLLSIVFARAGDFQAAGDFLVQAEHFRNRIINHGLRESHTRAKFELAYSEQRWNDAVEFSETSTELYQRSSYLWGWARSMIDLGDAFISRNETGDLERARETYQQSLDTFTEMGAPGYIQELEERLRKM